MPLGEHLRELRNRLMKAVLAILVVTVVAAFFQKEIFDFLLRPILSSVGCPDGASVAANGKPCAIIKTDTLLSPFTIALKVALMSGVLVATPVWLYQLWAFVAPGLHSHERKYAYVFVAVGAPLFLGGAWVAYEIIPQTAEIMLGFSPVNVQNQIALDAYLDLVTRMVIVFGLAFELPLFLVGLNFAGVFPGKRMLGWWRGMVLALTLFAAVATPGGDPLSMLLLAGPLCVLYFIAVGISIANDARRRRNNPDAALSDDEASDLDLTPEALGEVESVAPPRALPEQASGEHNDRRTNGYDDIT